MKKLLFLLVMMLLPMIASADAVEIDGIYYYLLSKGMIAEVTNNPTFYSGNVIIPDKVKYEGTEYSVTTIRDHAFKNCSDLTAITIPNSIISIGEGAFWGCRSLASINIPNSVTSIKENTFYYCSSLTSITIPNSVTSIGKYAFEYCSSLTSIIFPSSVTGIATFAFSNCSGLTSITFSYGVEGIGLYTFYKCTGLTSITFPNSVRSIANSAFEGCSGLTSVTFGKSIESIGSKAFASCPELSDVYCYAEAVPSAIFDAFDNSHSEYATLHVPASSVNAYKASEPWKNFNIIVAIDGDTPEASKCSLPKISYQNGKLSFSCDTEGVDFISEITDTDIKKNFTKDVDLTVTYRVSVYATKSGYDNSDVATATLCWIDVDPKTEGISNGVANVRAMPVMIQNNDNVLNISGAPEDSMITVYDLSGQMVGSAKAVSETTNISTSLQSGEIGIVKIGDKSVKVIMK